METSRPSSDDAIALGRLPLLRSAPVDLLLGAVSGLAPDVMAGTLRRLDPAAWVDGDLVGFPGNPPAYIRVAGARYEPELADVALSQTWDWPGAENAVGRTRAVLRVEEEESAVLPDRYERLRRLNVTLRACMEHLPVVAILWRGSERLVEPLMFAQSLAHGATVADHAVNVRMFRVPDGSPGEAIMDTLGLAPFGLPDLQIHFAGLDPAALAPVLLRYAEYLFEKGDVLDDDHLVRGTESLQEWVCHRRMSLAPPTRTVIGIVPDEHAAH